MAKKTGFTKFIKKVPIPKKVKAVSGVKSPRIHQGATHKHGKNLGIKPQPMATQPSANVNYNTNTILNPFGQGLENK